MKDKIFGVLQRVGRSFMLPIAILPIAGLFLGIGGSFTNPTMLAAYGLTEAMGPGTASYAILSVMSKCGDIVFANLPLIFAVGVAIGMAKKEKEVAAISAVIAFLIMHTSIGSLITINDATTYLIPGSVTTVVGIESLQMGVFGGMIVGLGVAGLHNKYYKIELPQVLSFFGGTRFVPIVSAVVYLVVGILMFYIWPTVQSGIYAIGDFVNETGYAGTFLYGFMERLLIPFGLHHVFYLPFWQTALGGTLMVDGTLVEGAQNIFFAQLASPNTEAFAVSATRFMSGKFPLMIFGLPGAALAMYHCAKPEKKGIVKGLLVSAAATAMLTGITEPLEFTFLFIAPVLYGIHCVGAGLAYMIMHILNVAVGMTFSGGIIDLTLYGILQGNAKTNWIMIPIVGVVYFVVYYLVFKLVIKKLNLKTPGREDDGEETKLYTRKDVDAKKQGKASSKSGANNEVSTYILMGLGGKDNLSDVDCCATRLRVTVNDASLVQEALLKQSGAAGVIVKGLGVQVIYGPQVSVIKSKFEDFLATPESDQLSLPVETSTEEPEENSEVVETSTSTSKSEAIIFSAPITGKMAPLSETPDETFAQEMLGRGVVFFPTNGELHAPCDALITLIPESKHAIGLLTDDGMEILLHVGIDTVNLDGKPFTLKVSEGDKVKKGDLLMEFDLDMIQNEAASIATPMIFTNLDADKEMSVDHFGHDVDFDTEVVTIS